MQVLILREVIAQKIRCSLMLISKNLCTPEELRVRMVELKLTRKGISVEGYEDRLFSPSKQVNQNIV